MINEKFYCADVSDTDSISEEYYKKLVEDEEDQRVKTDGEMFIIVKTEDKEIIEKEYSIKLKPLKYFILDYIIEGNEVAEQLHAIIKEDENIADFIIKNIMNDEILHKKLENELVEFAVGELYKQTDDEIVDGFITDSITGYCNYYIKRECYKLFIKFIKERYNYFFGE